MTFLDHDKARITAGASRWSGPRHAEPPQTRAQGPGGQSRGDPGERAAIRCGASTVETAGPKAVASSHATTAASRRHADDAQLTLPLRRIRDTSPASARSADSSAAGAVPISRARRNVQLGCGALPCSSRWPAPAKTKAPRLQRRDPCTSGETRLAAVFASPWRASAMTIASAPAAAAIEPARGQPRAESFDGSRLQDVERFALRDAGLLVDQPDFADAAARREPVRERAAESARANDGDEGHRSRLF